jgi:hypothetical protein
MAKPGIIASISRWFYRRKYGPIRDAAERTATDPGMVAAFGPAKAREVAYRQYGPILDEPTGNFAADAIVERIRGRREGRR